MDLKDIALLAALGIAYMAGMTLIIAFMVAVVR